MKALTLALIATLAALVLGYTVGPLALAGVGADPKTAELAVQYFDWYLPALALSFPTTALGAALRGANSRKSWARS